MAVTRTLNYVGPKLQVPLRLIGDTIVLPQFSHSPREVNWQNSGSGNPAGQSAATRG